MQSIYIFSICGLRNHMHRWQYFTFAFFTANCWLSQLLAHLQEKSTLTVHTACPHHTPVLPAYTTVVSLKPAVCKSFVAYLSEYTE
jgi:hypothetical protein